MRRIQLYLKRRSFKSMNAVDRVKSDLDRDLRGTEILGICNSIVDYVVSQRPENLRMLTYSSFARATKTAVTNPHLVLAVNYLANPFTVGALEKHYMIFAGAEDEVGQPISDHDVEVALKERLLVLPSGVEVQDVEAHLVAYFQPSSALAKTGAAG